MRPLAEVALLFPTKNGAFAPFLLPHAWPRLTSGSPRRIALGRSGLFSVHFFAAFRRGRLGVLVGRVFRPSLRRLSGLDVGLALVAIGAIHGITLRNGRSRGGASEKADFEGSRARSQFSECRRCRRPCRPVLSDNRGCDVTGVRGLARERFHIGMATSRPPCAGVSQGSSQ